jgi:hypothetical protein
MCGRDYPSRRHARSDPLGVTTRGVVEAELCVNVFWASIASSVGTDPGRKRADKQPQILLGLRLPPISSQRRVQPLGMQGRVV